MWRGGGEQSDGGKKGGVRDCRVSRVRGGRKGGVRDCRVLGYEGFER